MPWKSTNLEIFPQSAVDAANAEAAIMRSAFADMSVEDFPETLTTVSAMGIDAFVSIIPVDQGEFAKTFAYFTGEETLGSSTE